jgi:hypothetical protein
MGNLMFGSNYNDYRMKSGYKPKSSTEAEWIFHKTATWAKQFAWLPHRCELTKKIIWLRVAYQGIANYGYPGEDVYEYRWHRYDEHIIWELQK